MSGRPRSTWPSDVASTALANPTSSADPAGFVRPELRQLPAYHLDLVPVRHKLDQNEVPFELPRRVKERVVRELLARDWARYPDFHADRLREALGALNGWPAAGVLVGNGSNELLGLACEALIPPGAEVLTLLPGFGLYPMFVRRAAGVPRSLGPRHDLALPLDELFAAVERDPLRPVILCTPNNPTGAQASVEVVDALLARLEAPLLLDNAYGEMADVDYRPLLARHRHLLIFRTFSKAWSLAGMRIGYLLADPSLVAELIKVKLPYNLNLASALAAEAALAAVSDVARRVEVLRGRRRQLAAVLAAAGLETFASAANFVLVRCPPLGVGDSAAELGDEEAVRTARQAVARRLRDELAARSILVRDVSAGPGLAGCLRVSVPSGPSLRALASALAEIAPAIGLAEAAAGDSLASGGDHER